MRAKYIIVILTAVMCLLPSCKMRPRDVERLKAEADAGNFKSMETLMCHGDTLVPVWATWIWVILFVVLYFKGIQNLRKQGRLTVLSALKYTLATILINILFYLLGGALSIFSEVIAIIAVICLVGALIPASSPKEGDIILYGEGLLGSDVMASPVPGRPGVYRTADGRYYQTEPGGNLKQLL